MPRNRKPFVRRPRWTPTATVLKADTVARSAREDEMTIRVLLIGCGNMGYAMLSGWLGSGQARRIGDAGRGAQRGAQASRRAARRHGRGIERRASGVAEARTHHRRRQAAGHPRRGRRLHRIRGGFHLCQHRGRHQRGNLHRNPGTRRGRRALHAEHARRHRQGHDGRLLQPQRHRDSPDFRQHPPVGERGGRDRSTTRG